MSLLQTLYAVTAGGLAVSALALLSLWRSGVALALGMLLGLNAGLVALNLLGSLPNGPAWLGAPLVTVGWFAAFTTSPPLLAVAVARSRSADPLDGRDGARLMAAALFGACLGAAGWIVPGLSQPALSALRMAGVLLVAGLALAGAAGGATGAGGPRPVLRAIVGAYAAHWGLSMASWAAAVAGWPAAGTLEGLSVSALLVFGLGAAGAGLRGVPARLASTGGPGEPAPPRPAAPPPEDVDLAEVLNRCLDEDGVYLDPELTVDALAGHARSTARDVSRVLGSLLDGGFHEAVARRRVGEAQRLLIAEPDALVIDVLHRAGFSSKSAFHRAFKAYAGTTPLAYRRRMAGTAVPLPAAGRPRAA